MTVLSGSAPVGGHTIKKKSRQGGRSEKKKTYWLKKKKKKKWKQPQRKKLKRGQALLNPNRKIGS